MSSDDALMALVKIAYDWAALREIELEQAIDELQKLTRLGAAHGIGRESGMDWYLSQLGDA